MNMFNGVRAASGLVFIHDRYDPVTRQSLPLVDQVCMVNPLAIGRTVTGKTTPLTLKELRKNYRDLRAISLNCDRSRAYVMVGLSEYRSPIAAKSFSGYLQLISRELDFAGYDTCFVEIIFNDRRKCGNIRVPHLIETWGERYKECFGEGFEYEKIKIVLDHEGNINALPLESYVNLWETISEDYQEWSCYV